MNSIGGYFELELRKGEEFHKNAIHLNSGRNALELILKVKQYKKVYIPYYTCEVIIEPFHKLNIEYEFYSIDEKFEPLFKFNSIKEDEGFLYINYFGIKNAFVSALAKYCKTLIVDNSQAFFASPTIGSPTFYSCRKFFGVPDGAYLYLDGVSEQEFKQDYSTDRFKHLTKRIDFEAEIGYPDFKENENRFKGQPIMQMSKLTKALLCNIDYEITGKKRRENFKILHEKISIKNELKVKLNSDCVPMTYPFLTSQSKLKQKLIKNKIFVATYWPNVTNLVKKESLEYRYASQLIPLPIDQRTDKAKLNEIIKNIM